MGSQWNPSNAIALMDYVSAQGLAGCIDWQLGNEPDLYHTLARQTSLSPQQVGSPCEVVMQPLLDSPPPFVSGGCQNQSLFHPGQIHLIYM